MSLSTTQKYVLAVLSPENKLSVLKKGNSGICLVVSCIWDMLFAKVAVLNEKGKMEIISGLPIDLEYCRPIYDELVSKANKPPKKIILSYTTALTDKRMLGLAEAVVLQLSNQGYLTAIGTSGLSGQKVWKPKENLLESIFSALKELSSLGERSVENNLMLAILLLESGLAKKLFRQSDIKELKENVSNRDTLNLQPYLRNMISLVEQEISSAIASAAVSIILTN